ncbi:MAG: VWA-like domain-containing protein, partial [Pseudomonadota bacterium]
SQGVVTWGVVLRRLMTKALTQDRAPDYRRPARRWLALEGSARQRGTDQPAFLPATRQDRELPRIVIGLDTSGSVDTLRLKNFAAQVTAIARRARAELHLLVFDLTVRSHTRLTGPNIAERIANIAFARDGGTSFVVVIEEAVALDPSIIVILTDLEGPFGRKAPTCPVIWALPGEAPAPRKGPPFGRVLSLSR